MKKSLIALAVLAASGAAMAQSSVTLYGIADIGLAYTDDGVDTKTSLDSGNRNGSRWGMRGTEDLGNGLKAIFVLESGFNLDTGAQADSTRLFNRQAFVGLTGGFGTVKLGRQTNPIFSNSSTFDPFGNSLAGDSGRLFNYQGSRTDNAISYNYAANGFRGELQYALGEVAGNSGASSMMGGFLGYKAGPIDVVLTYEDLNNATDTDSAQVMVIGGNYDFGVAKAFLTYNTEEGTGTVDKSHWLVGATVPLGGGTLILSYIARQNDQTDNADAEQFGIGYVYDLSKRTALYTSYGQVSNDAKSSVRVAKAGETGTQLNVGVRHSF
jgi:predicted porin